MHCKVLIFKLFGHRKSNTMNPQQKRDQQGKFTTGSGGLRLRKKINWRRAAPVIAVVSFVGGMLVYQSFAAINRPAYRYSARVCTSGRTKQVTNCRTLSAEAMVFRLYKGIANQNPSSNAYQQEVRSLIVDKTDPSELAQELLSTHNANNLTHLAFMTDIYQRLFGKSYDQEKTAIDQWVAQLARGNQTRLQAVLYLVKQTATREHLADSFFAYYEQQPLVNIDSSTPEEPVDPEEPEEPVDPEEPEEPVDPEEPEEPIDPEEPEEPAGNTMNVVFLGVKFHGDDGDATFDAVTEDLKNALMTHKPFSDMPNAISFEKLNWKNYDFECHGGMGEGGDPDDRLVICHDTLSINGLLSGRGIEADKIAVIINNTLYGGSAVRGGKYLFMNAAPTTSLKENTFVHEFGHLMALRDEYLDPEGVQATYDSNPGMYHNRMHGQCMAVDSVPSDWRTTPGVWTTWKDTPDVSWHIGCAADHWYRPSQTSIMQSIGGTFNTVSIEVMEAHWQQFID